METIKGVILIIVIVFLVLMFISFIAGMVELYNAPTDKELYGMSAEAYWLQQVGEREFKKYHSEAEYERCKIELEALKRKSDEL